MKKILLGVAAAATMTASAPQPAMACPVVACDPPEAVDAVVGVVVHALWPTLRHVGPLIEQIKP